MTNYYGVVHDKYLHVKFGKEKSSENFLKYC